MGDASELRWQRGFGMLSGVHPLLLLWDIDGTLISSGGAGEESLRQTLLNRFGIIDDLSEIEISGRTDPAIIRDICRKFESHGLQPETFLEGYLEYLPDQLRRKKGSICPGVTELLRWSHEHPEVHNALLTGNVRKGADLKLRHFGLDSYFEFGAFGDDSMDRNELGPIALERARRFLKRDFHIEFTWVIGDTPRDIECARALGCKVLAVGTGRYSMKDLSPYNPEILVPDLRDRDGIIQELELNRRSNLRIKN